jgi:hypothetical protein
MKTHAYLMVLLVFIWHNVLMTQYLLKAPEQEQKRIINPYGSAIAKNNWRSLKRK